MKARLSGVVELVDFRVFGSRARGEADEFSDFDVFIEVETLDAEIKQKSRDIAWEVGFEHLIHISPLVFSRHEVEDSPLKVSPIIANISSEGVFI
ncbi:MAG: hypothetical protein A2X56_05600 [Nitrospirae bacterium GWC2_57_13]|nr:MAG: hypothetical protein A2072_03595 [Nitrospirae bacterium GWC1_57_7]OGW29893.1 MAG: hypothetical protein A2X56_05600 [Nitrospirae bacterium GWC2_57_13]